MRKTPHILHQEILDEVKDRVQETSGLCPHKWEIAERNTGTQHPTLHKGPMRCMLTGKIKCRTFWNKVLEHNDRAFCSFCKWKQNTEVVETEEHMCKPRHGIWWKGPGVGQQKENGQTSC